MGTICNRSAAVDDPGHRSEGRAHYEPGPMVSIDFDESEYKQSAVSDELLHLILLFHGPEVRDLFLYGGDDIVEPDSVSNL